jgi:hypothetical protein
VHYTHPELQLEAAVFAEAARKWLDHLLIGDIGLVEGVDAARVLLRRAHLFAAAA